MVAVLLAEGFETIEALTPVDYLRRAGAQVRTISITAERTVLSSHHIPVVADGTLDDLAGEDIELLFLPGGLRGTQNLEASPAVQRLIDDCVAKGAFVAAICAAPSILGHKGLLSGKRATCYTGFEEALVGTVSTGAPVEADGQFITGRGAGVANQFAFALIQALFGAERAAEIRAQVLYAD